MTKSIAQQVPQKSKRTIGKPFTKGDPRINAGGRPKGSISLRAAALRELTPGKAESVIRRLYKSAMAGSIAASKLLAELTGDLGVNAQTVINNLNQQIEMGDQPSAVIILPDNHRNELPALTAIDSPHPPRQLTEISSTVETKGADQPVAAEPLPPPPKPRTWAEVQIAMAEKESEMANAEARRRLGLSAEHGKMGHGSHSTVGPLGAGIFGL